MAIPSPSTASAAHCCPAKKRQRLCLKTFTTFPFKERQWPLSGAGDYAMNVFKIDGKYYEPIESAPDGFTEPVWAALAPVKVEEAQNLGHRWLGKKIPLALYRKTTSFF